MSSLANISDRIQSPYEIVVLEHYSFSQYNSSSSTVLVSDVGEGLEVSSATLNFRFDHLQRCGGHYLYWAFSWHTCFQLKARL